jgi:glutathione-independent formaldehyde dehydrogenase
VFLRLPRGQITERRACRLRCAIDEEKSSMRAVVWKSPNTVVVENVEDPRIQEETDAVLRLTTAAICGSDLHMYEGRAPVQPGEVFGHENLGVIEKVGSAVRSIKVGDRVVLPFNIGCGFCFNCSRGFSNACLTTNPQGHGGGYGYSGMGTAPRRPSRTRARAVCRL